MISEDLKNFEKIQNELKNEYLYLHVLNLIDGGRFSSFFRMEQLYSFARQRLPMTVSLVLSE